MRTAKILMTGLTVLLLASPAAADLFFWRVDTNDRRWSNHVNWSGPTGQIPNDAEDTVYVQGVTGFDPQVDLTYRIGNLIIRLGGDLFNGNGTTNNSLVVTSVGGNTGRTLITDSGSSLTIYRGTGVSDFDTDDLALGSGAALKLRDGGKVQVDDKLSISAGAQIDGAGTVELSRIDGENDPSNDGLIWAFGGTLEFFGHANTRFDLDGASEDGVLEANNDSTLVFDLAVENQFNGTMRIDPGGEMRINHPWTLASEAGSTLSFNGGFDIDRAMLSGATATMLGTIFVNTGDALLDAEVSFGTGAEVNLAGGTTMQVATSAFVEQGVVFAGTGELIVNDGAQLEFDHDAGVGVAVRNDGNLLIADDSPTAVAVASFVQGPTGTCEFTTCGQSDGASYDRLTVAGTATLDGRLDLTLSGGCELAVGEQIPIITASNVVGEFAQVAGIENVEVVYTETTVTVVVTADCPADLDGDGMVGYFEVLAILTAWGNPGGPEDIDGDGEVGFGDVLMVLAIWGPCE